MILLLVQKPNFSITEAFYPPSRQAIKSSISQLFRSECPDVEKTPYCPVNSAGVN